MLVKVGDSITTDHISPAGTIKADSPAGACASAASSPSTSTRTAPDEATTR